MDRLNFRQLFRALASPHMLLDRDLRYVAANPAYEAAVGRTEAELIGVPLSEAFPDDGESGRILTASLRRVFETGQKDTLAYIPYQMPRPESEGGGTEVRFWSAVHSPMTDEAGEVIFVLQNTVDITEIVRLRDTASGSIHIAPGEMELVQRAREAEAAVRDAQDGSLTFRRLFENAPGMVAVLQGPEHHFTFANAQYLRFVGRDVLGLSVRRALPELEGQRFFELLDDVSQNGTSHVLEGQRILLHDDNGERLREAYLDFSYHPLREADGRITGIFVQAYERTDAVLLQQRQRLLLDELNHRVKNTLSTVQSIARQSFRGVHSPDQAQTTFDARLRALSQAHDILSDRHWESAELKAILMQELSVYDNERVSASGTLTRLNPKAAIAFAMVFHELASNAAKYGALNEPDGTLDITWRRGPVDGREHLHLAWVERGAATAGKVLSQGFGIRMLQRIVTGELEGRLDLAFRDEGLICRIDIPISEVETLAGSETG